MIDPFLVVKTNKSPILLWTFSIILLVVIPLIYSTSTVDITLVPQFLALDIFLIFSLTTLAFFKVQRVYCFPINPISILLVCYLLFSVTSIIGAVNPKEGIFDLMKIVLWIQLIIVLINLLENKSEYKSILTKAFAIASFAMAAIGALQIAGIAFINIPGHLVPYGTLGNRNIFVPALLLTLPFVINEVVFSTNKIWKIFAIVSGLLNITVVLASGMRTGILAVLVCVFITSVVLIFFNKKLGFGIQETLISKLKIVFLTGVLLGVGVTVFVIVNKDRQHANTGNILSMNSTNERIALWKKSIKMLEEHPANGVGVGNWRIELPGYGLSDLPHEVKIGEMHYQRPENDFVWTLAETGIAGGLSYVLIFIAAFYFILKQMKMAANGQQKVFSLLIFAALIIYSVVAFFGFPKERTYLSIELAVIFALAISLYQQYKGEGAGRKIKVYSVFLFLIPVIIDFVGVSLLTGEKDTVQIIKARENNDNEAVIKYADDALKEGFEIDNSSTPIAFYRGVAYFAENKLKQATKDFEAAYKVHPNHLHVLNNLATCYEMNGEHEKAIEYLEKAIRISPDYTDAGINLAALYNNIGDVKLAQETLNKCVSSYTNPQYNKTSEAIKGKINDSLLSLAKKYFEADELEKATEELLQCIHFARDARFQELKKNIAIRRRQLLLTKK